MADPPEPDDYTQEESQPDDYTQEESQPDDYTQEPTLLYPVQVSESGSSNAALVVGKHYFPFAIALGNSEWKPQPFVELSTIQQQELSTSEHILGSSIATSPPTKDSKRDNGEQAISVSKSEPIPGSIEATFQAIGVSKSEPIPGSIEAAFQQDIANKAFPPKLHDSDSIQKTMHNKDLHHTFVIDSKIREQLYSWSQAEFHLYLPPGPLPDDVHGKIIRVKTNMADRYQFPPNTKPVSAIFTITTPVKLERLELEHCYRGDINNLAFLHCQSDRPPYVFDFANPGEYECYFTSSRGFVKISHACHWCIVRRRIQAVQRVFWHGFRSLSWSSDSEDVWIYSYYNLNLEGGSSIIVDIVILESTGVNSKVVETAYPSPDWTPCSSPRTATFRETATSSIKIVLPSESTNIGNGWMVEPVAPPMIERVAINKKYYQAIRLRYTWDDYPSELRHMIVLEGLKIADTTAYVNLYISRIPSRPYSIPNMKNLTFFRGKNRTINIIDEIGRNYKNFAMCLLNDDNLVFVNQIEKDYTREQITSEELQEKITRKILQVWIESDGRAEPLNWASLITVLRNMGLFNVADEIMYGLLS